jgi:predicted RNase H-like HicB family nuclease
MTYKIHLHIEKLPENLYLATSDDVQGLVAQGRSISETIEIARDVARKLLEAQTEPTDLESISEEEAFDMPVFLEV